ncbi:hypothetical protein [Kutzneria buriramensis]|nr:hypothetical protein [Kutzneria buriramensis]
MPEADKLYEDYLSPGRASLVRTRITAPQVLAGFRNAQETKAAVGDLVGELVAKLPSKAPVFGADQDLRQVGLGQNVPISWGNLETYPGFLAGGLSGVELPGGTTIPDRRDIFGKYTLAKTAAQGHTKVTLTVHGLILRVLDSVDFCPGNLGTGMIRDVALGLSRLERTPYQDGRKCGPDSNCTVAKPVQFEVALPLDDVSIDVTSKFVGRES